MQNKMILIAAGTVAVAVAVGAFVFMSRNAPDAGENMESSLVGQGNRSLRDLLSANEDLRCTFSYDDGDVQSSGVAYTAQNVIRVDSESLVRPTGMTTRTSSIIDPDYVYVWMDGGTEGYRIAFVDVEAGAGGETAPDYDREHEYDCEPWQVDEGVFQPPAGVTFIDPMDMLRGLVPTAGAEGSANADAAAEMRVQMCGLCDQANDPTEVAQCKAALGCG